MNFKSFFKYAEPKQHSFTLESTQDIGVDPINEKKDQKIYSNLKENLEYMQVEYNRLINSDIVFREFSIVAKNIEYKTLLVYIDGMVDTDLINNYVIKPLMTRNQNTTFENDIKLETDSNKIILQKLKDRDLVDYIYNNLMPQNAVSKENTFSKIISGINAGNCGLLDRTDGGRKGIRAGGGSDQIIVAAITFSVSAYSKGA